MQDKELKKVVCYKIGKFDNTELEEEDFGKVEELNINNRSFSGEMKNISLDELRKFPNLKSISLQYFHLDDSFLSIIDELPKLQVLQLVSCRLDFENQLRCNSLRCLELNCCEMDDISRVYSPKQLIILGDNNLRLDKVYGKENIEIMRLQESRIKGFKTILECHNLKELNIDGSKVDDQETLEEVRKRVTISELDEYRPMR